MDGDPRNEPTFVGLLDLFEIPYTGADLLALASCLLQAAHQGHPDRARGPDAAVSLPADPAALDDPALDALDYPWFVKLAHEDASVGITEENLVRDAGGAARARRELMIEYHQPRARRALRRGPRDQRDPDRQRRRRCGCCRSTRSTSPRCPPIGRASSATPRSGTRRHVDYAGTKPVPLRDASPALRRRGRARVARARGTRSGCATTAASICASMPPARRG